jgi:hypothetical protein
MADESLHIADLRHPDYKYMSGEWDEWRDTFKGGQDYLDMYLKKFSSRETDSEFATRKECTPIPTFAKAAILDIRNSIFQRLVEVSRSGGSVKYHRAVGGEGAGVDREGSSMDSFMGIDVLTEILVMGSAGIFVDAPNKVPTTMAEGQQSPYLYYYRREDILNWSLDEQAEDGTFKAVLLRDYCIGSYQETRSGIILPHGRETRKRLIWKGEDGVVRCRFYTLDNEIIYVEGSNANGDVELGIPIVPFVWPTIGESLLADVSSYQKALLNLVSGDVNWALRSNVPFLTIQEEMRTAGSHLKRTADSAEPGGQSAQNREEVVGGGKGRFYDVGMDRPDYIAPPTAPLEASMKLQEKLEDDIRKLVNLAVTNKAGSRTESAEAKKLSSQGLEAGLSFIGTVLEQAEQAVARYWTMYERSTDVPKVSYPSRYILKEDSERLKETKDLLALKDQMPGTKTKKVLTGMALEAMLSGRITVDKMLELRAELEEAGYCTSDLEQVIEAYDQGLCTRETASEALGYNPNKVDEATEEMIERKTELQRPNTEGGVDENGNDGGAVNRDTDAEAESRQAARPEKEGE